MNAYTNSLISGELWVRNENGFKETANHSLSAVYNKYSTKYPTFFSDLSSNKIVKFDTFYDCIYVETPNGAIFEKIIQSEEGIVPFNQVNLHIPRFYPQPGVLPFNTGIDYWFDEDNKKVIYGNLVALDDNKYFSDRFVFSILVNEFDCQTGLIKTLLFDRVTIGFSIAKNWDIYDYVMEDPKITYNSFTNRYNLSFLLKNIAREFGLVSITFGLGDVLERQHYEIYEVNGHLPYFNIDLEKTNNSPYVPGVRLPYRILTVASKPFLNNGEPDPAYNLKFIIATTYETLVTDDQVPIIGELVDKYLVTE